MRVFLHIFYNILCVYGIFVFVYECGHDDDPAENQCRIIRDEVLWA